MPQITKYKTECTNVFALNGQDENSATFALGWTLSQSPSLLMSLLERCGITASLEDAERTEILLQEHSEQGGYTDLELRCLGLFHIIFEAKTGWELPTVQQIRLYTKRLDRESTPDCRVCSISAASILYSQKLLPPDIEGFTLNHLSWKAIKNLVSGVAITRRSPLEKLWLSQLENHIRGYDLMTTPTDNTALCVVLSGGALNYDENYTWVDVVTKDNSYFHPLGTNGWPASPPNYVAFRKDGKLMSVHHVDSYDVVSDLNSVNSFWPSTEVDHFVYKLGPAIIPAKEIKNGKLWANARIRCAIDTLLSGAYATIADARDETQRRLEGM